MSGDGGGGVHLAGQRRVPLPVFYIFYARNQIYQ